jgi:hypothetical protein
MVDAGNVGIGCNAPGTILDVNGTARATSFSNASTTSNSIGGSTLYNGNITTNSFNVGQISILPQTANGYSIQKIRGGNANGYLYGDYQLLDDGIHIGYNAYGSNGAWVNPNSFSNTRISMGYNYIGLFYGTTTGSATAGPSNTALYMNSNGNIGVATSTPATALDVNGGLTIRNGLRPLFSNITSGTSFTAGAYGSHYNITTSTITGITLPTVTASTDSNAYWLFRNNTSGYLSMTFTYTTAGTTFPTNPVVIPPANSITMAVTYPSSVLGYVLF